MDKNIPLRDTLVIPEKQFFFILNWDKQGRSIYQMDSINILSIHNVCKIRKDLFLNVIDSKTGRSFDNSNN